MIEKVSQNTSFGSFCNAVVFRLHSRVHYSVRGERSQTLFFKTGVGGVFIAQIYIAFSVIFIIPFMKKPTDEINGGFKGFPKLSILNFD